MGEKFSPATENGEGTRDGDVGGDEDGDGNIYCHP